MHFSTELAIKDIVAPVSHNMTNSVSPALTTNFAAMSLCVDMVAIVVTSVIRRLFMGNSVCSGGTIDTGTDGGGSHSVSGEPANATGANSCVGAIWSKTKTSNSTVFTAGEVLVIVAP